EREGPDAPAAAPADGRRRAGWRRGGCTLTRSPLGAARRRDAGAARRAVGSTPRGWTSGAGMPPLYSGRDRANKSTGPREGMSSEILAEGSPGAPGPRRGLAARAGAMLPPRLMSAAPVATVLERQLREVTALNATLQALTSTLDLPEILRIVLEHTKHVTSAEGLSLLLYDRERDEIVFAATETLQENTLACREAPLPPAVGGLMSPD